MPVVFLTSASTSPWSRPSDWADAGHTVELVGAGGQSGAASTGTSGRGGAGGGGGAYGLLTRTSGALAATTPFDVNINNTTASQTTNATTWEAAVFTSAYYAGPGQPGATTTAGAAGAAATSNGTPSPVTYTITTARAGAAGGAASTTQIAGGGGGGGAGGPAAAGGAGGATSAATGTGGGGGGGAANNGVTGVGASNTSNVAGVAGGTGVGPSHGGGAGSSSVTSPGNGSAGIGGQGGGGGASSTATTASMVGSGYAGGPNGNTTNWVQTSDSSTAGAGGGGGGGGGFSGNTTVTTNGGAGGSYGGGGGGPGGMRGTGAGAVGQGASGLIVITYTAAGGTKWQAVLNPWVGAGALTANATRVPAGGAVPASLVLSNNVLHYTLDATLPPETLLHFDGTSGSQTITDTGSHTWTATGTAVNAQLSTAQKKFGTASVLFTDNNSSISGDGTINFGTKDFTIDFWVYRNGSQGQNNYLNITDTGHVIYLSGSGGSLRFYMGGDAITGPTGGLTDNAWHHIALTRQASVFYLFLDGVLQGTYSPGSVDLGTCGAGFPQINYPGFGLVGYLDEFRILIGEAAWTGTFTAPTVAYTTDSAVADTSGNNNTGTLDGTGTTLVAGYIGNALSFNSNGYISLSNVSLINLATKSSEISASCWINTASLNGVVLCLRATAGNPIINFSVGANGVDNVSTGKLGLLIRDSGGAGLTTVNSTTTLLTDGNWHHIAFTRNSSQLITLYVDGASAGSGTDTCTSGITFDTIRAVVAQESYGAVPNYTGLLDDLQIYNRALTATEINSIYSYTTTPAQTYQISASLAGAGVASWPTVDPIDQLMVWSAVLAGAGGASWSTVQLLKASSSLSGTGTLAANVIRLIPVGSILAAAVGSLTAQAGISSSLSTALAGTGAASWPTVDPIDQLLLAKAALTGAGSQSSVALSVLLGTASVMSGAGTAQWPTTDPIDQLMVASSILAGSGSLAGDVIRVTAAGVLWQAVLNPWAGASTLAAQATACLPAFSSMAGAAALTVQAGVGLAASAVLGGASALASTASLGLSSKAAFSGAGAASWPTVDPIDQLLVASSGLAGAGASASSLLTLRPVTATFAGASTQLASITARMPSAAALAGTATLASNLSQSLLLSSSAWAGASGTVSSLAQQLSAAVLFTAAGTLLGDAPVQRAASAALAGAGILNAASAQWLTSIAVAAGAGLLTAAPIQWQNIATLASGTGALGGDVYIPGHNIWSAVLQVWPTAGSLIATTTARLGAVTAPWAAASTLTGSLTARSPISAVAAAGAGQLAPAVSSLQLGTNASWSGAGALAANSYRLLAINSSVLTGLVGGLATTPAQWMFATSALSGAGAIVGDIVKLTGGILRPIDAVVYLGTSALTAQTTQLLAGLTAWSGAGALSLPSVSVIEPVTLSPAGQGSMAASAAMRMSAVFAAAGASLLAIDHLAQGMAAGAFLSGAGALLSAEGLRLQARSVLAGSGLLQVDVLAPRGLAALFAATSSLQASSRLLGSLVATQAGAGSLAAKTIGALATQSLLSSSSQLTTGLTAFEQIAGTLAAAGYSAAYLGEIQLLRQQILFGSGVLGANLVQASIRVVSATIIGRQSESSGIIGRNPTAATITGQDPRAGIIGRKPTATAMTGQDPRAGVIGQGDFVTLH